jgi:hypothetical protein
LLSITLCHASPLKDQGPLGLLPPRPRHGGWRVRSPAAPYRACGGRWRGFRRGTVLAQGRPRAGQVAPEKSNSAQGTAGLGSADVSSPSLLPRIPPLRRGKIGKPPPRPLKPPTAYGDVSQCPRISAAPLLTANEESTACSRAMRTRLLSRLGNPNGTRAAFFVSGMVRA